MALIARGMREVPYWDGMEDGSTDHLPTAPFGIYFVRPELVTAIEERYGAHVIDICKSLLRLDAASTDKLPFTRFSLMAQRSIVALLEADKMITAANGLTKANEKKTGAPHVPLIPTFGAKKLSVKGDLAKIFKDYVLAIGGLPKGAMGHNNLMAVRVEWQGHQDAMSSDAPATHVHMQIKNVARQIIERTSAGRIPSGHKAVAWARKFA
jgi:hypothetical protein